ncbi:MAG: AbrB/MazE/SpoVT family DNA-binding domain-containing protein [Tepidiformaceae bacterium]
MRVVTMNSAGRITVPAEARRELGLAGEAEFEMEVDAANDAIILRPALVLRRDDAWAYTAEHREALARAHADAREGRVRSLTEEELAALGGDAD